MSRNAKTVLVLALVCVAAALYFFLRRPGGQTPTPPSQPTDETAAVPAREATPQAPNPTVSSTPAPAAATAATPPNRQLAPPPPPATPFQFGSADNPPNMEPATVVENMRIAINLYRSMFGNN